MMVARSASRCATITSGGGSGPRIHRCTGVAATFRNIAFYCVLLRSTRMLIFRAGDRLALRAGPRGARLLLLGGAAMDGPRHLFWNFVCSSRERIEQAKADWKAGHFGKVPGDMAEFIPLPG